MSVRTYLTHFPESGNRVYIDPMAAVIGRVSLADDVSVWPMCTLRGDVHYIQVGARSNIQDGSVLHVTSPHEGAPEGYPLIIGEDVTVGHNVTLHACRIGNECLIGMGAIILDGAVIEDRVMIAAGSLVSPGKVLESGGLYLGNPARRVRDLTEEELAFFRESAAHYVKLKDQHLASSRIIED